MRKKQNKQELVEKRKVALELLDKGKSASEVAELERIGRVICELFGIRYVASGVWHVMARMSWNSQKIQRVAIQREEQQVWPRIKKVA